MGVNSIKPQGIVHVKTCCSPQFLNRQSEVAYGSTVEVMRIALRLNEDVDKGWISYKTRFCYIRWKRQFESLRWRDALVVVAEVIHRVKMKRIIGIIGKLSYVESLMSLQYFLNQMGSNNIW